jgi:hypothetical protein
MTKILFFLGMMTIPFSGVVGLGFLGELQNNLSTYFFIAAIVSGAQFFATSSGVLRAQGQEIPSTKLLPGIMLAVTSVIVVSFFVNAGSILTNVSHGRHAIEKFVSSFVLILYSFMLAYLTFFMAGHGWKQAICKPIAISALLCVAFSVFEILSRNMGIATGVYAFLDGIVHGGAYRGAYTKGWDPRIRSLAFEPPAFGLYAGFAWPWLTAGWVSSHGRARRGYAIVWVFMTPLTLVSGSRSGLILVTGAAFVLAALRYGYLPPKPYKKGKSIGRVLTVFLTCLVLAAVLYCAANLHQYETAVIAGTSESDLGRLASTEAAFNMFLDNPVFGLGLGQYGFYVGKYVPPWGHLSEEIAAWLTKPGQHWPAAYFLYARLAGELGLASVVMWIGLWIWLARRVLIASLDYQRATGLVPTAAYPLIASCFCVLFSGFTNDTLATPMIWVTLGLCCRFLFEIRRYVQQHHDLRHLKFKQHNDSGNASARLPRARPASSAGSGARQVQHSCCCGVAGMGRAKIAKAMAIITKALHSNTKFLHPLGKRSFESGSKLRSGIQSWSEIGEITPAVYGHVVR